MSGQFPNGLGTVLSDHEYAQHVQRLQREEQQRRINDHITSVATEAVKSGQKTETPEEPAPAREPVASPVAAPDAALGASARLGAITAPNPVARAFGAGLVAGIVVGGLASMAMRRGQEQV